MGPSPNTVADGPTRSWQLRHVATSAALGLVSLWLAKLISFSVPFVGWWCLPICAFSIGWKLPGGTPGASLAVGVYLWSVPLSESGGPTASALREGLRWFVPATMLIGEVFGCFLRLGSRRDEATD